MKVQHPGIPESFVDGNHIQRPRVLEVLPAGVGKLAELCKFAHQRLRLNDVVS